MACQSVRLPNGVTAIVCGPKPRTRRCACGAPATRECDWKVKARRSGTCDRPRCQRCTTSPAPDKDLCPDHAAAFEAWKAKRPTSEAGKINKAP